MTSPFSESRFEHEARHYYYLPQTCFPRLERPKPTYLIGSRGSGKTTLMKALHWKERLENTTLTRQLGGQPFRGAFIGNYFKLPKIQIRSFHDWLESGGETNYGLVFGFYIDLTCLELIAHSVAELLARQELKISVSSEAQRVEKWLADYPIYHRFRNEPPPRSVADFRARIREIRRALEQHAMQQASLSDTFKEFTIEQIGSFASSVAKHVAELCDESQGSDAGNWHFKVCMDEGEVLNETQQRVLNTLLRHSEWPLIHILSYVSHPADMSTTMSPELTVQKADAQILMLDEFKAPAFQEFAEGVATVRCQELLQDTSVAFNTKAVLGSLNINRLLRTIIDRSEAPEAQHLLSNAQKMRPESTARQDPPIWEAYLFEQLEIGDVPVSPKEQRRQRSTKYRKGMASAYLSICNALKVRDIPYASADMVLSISDNCIRDFLSQLDHIYKDCGLELRDFLIGEIDWGIQAKAIREASREKRDSIPRSGVLRPVEAGHVIKGLAMITARIQSWSEDKSHLRSTERGIFRFACPTGSTGLDRAIKLVRDAADAGFLRLEPKEGQEMHFRVHASLAPAFGFSYRGAYYSVTLPLSDFDALRRVETDADLKKAADAIAAKLSRQHLDQSMPLFEELDDE